MRKSQLLLGACGVGVCARVLAAAAAFGAEFAPPSEFIIHPMVKKSPPMRITGGCSAYSHMVHESTTGYEYRRLWFSRDGEWLQATPFHYEFVVRLEAREMFAIYGAVYKPGEEGGNPYRLVPRGEWPEGVSVRPDTYVVHHQSYSVFGRWSSLYFLGTETRQPGGELIAKIATFGEVDIDRGKLVARDPKAVRKVRVGDEVALSRTDLPGEDTDLRFRVANIVPHNPMLEIAGWLELELVKPPEEIAP